MEQIQYHLWSTFCKSCFGLAHCMSEWAASPGPVICYMYTVRQVIDRPAAMGVIGQAAAAGGGAIQLRRQSRIEVASFPCHRREVSSCDSDLHISLIFKREINEVEPRKQAGRKMESRLQVSRRLQIASAGGIFLTCSEGGRASIIRPGRNVQHHPGQLFAPSQSLSPFGWTLVLLGNNPPMIRVPVHVAPNGLDALPPTSFSW
ncbi:hypothetical protein B0H65DRAFT_315614 [Neurospora tetraspora]|uniref:Uncharacterized protein n=1 Tax=Neurospora tetraspora TaxID=94610 RepID=A0AAE0J8K2_9PEZI|nr:hypothetical protein B0H65DRAFT_315614 [Neurospora tetraspora]